jgi:hypothetical protein
MSLVAIQTKGGEIESVNFWLAREGFLKKGYEIVTFDDYSEIPLDRSPIVVGGIPIVKRVLGEMGKSVPALDYPDSVRGFLGREVWRGVLGDLDSHLEGPRVFVKPVEQKLFTGTDIMCFEDRFKFSHCPDDTPVYFSEVRKFVSEWRCYVVEGELLQMCFYRGDSFILPDPETPRRILRAMQESGEAPISFAIDIGVYLKTPQTLRQTLLVEVNDGFALGNYGLPSIPYAHLIETRWLELTK